MSNKSEFRVKTVLFESQMEYIGLNNSDKESAVTLKVNPGKFPVKLKEFSKLEDITSPVAVFHPEATEPDIFDYKAGSAKIDMRPRNFRLLIFR